MNSKQLISLFLLVLINVARATDVQIKAFDLSNKLEMLSMMFREHYTWLSHEDTYLNRFGIITPEDALRLKIIRSSKYLAWVNEQIVRSIKYSLFQGYLTQSQVVSLQQYQDHLVDIKVKLIKTRVANWKYLSKTGLTRKLVRLLTPAPPSEPFSKMTWVPQLYLALVEGLERVVFRHQLSSSYVPQERLKSVLDDLHDIGIIMDFARKDMDRRFLQQLISVFGSKPLASIASEYMKYDAQYHVLETEQVNRGNFLTLISP